MFCSQVGMLLWRGAIFCCGGGGGGRVFFAVVAGRDFLLLVWRRTRSAHLITGLPGFVMSQQQEGHNRKEKVALSHSPSSRFLFFLADVLVTAQLRLSGYFWAAGMTV